MLTNRLRTDNDRADPIGDGALSCTTRSAPSLLFPCLPRSRSIMSTENTEQVELMPAESADMAQANNPANHQPLIPPAARQ